MLEAAECFRVDDAVAVTLEGSADGRLLLRGGAGSLGSLGRQGGEALILLPFQPVSYCVGFFLFRHVSIESQRSQRLL
jgi:hypothetical protein